jgi:Domain of Unknown Function (DUF928)
MSPRNSAHAFGALLLVSLTLAAGPAQAGLFAPPPDQGAPSQSTGGASRGGIKFAPPQGQGAPSQSSGGASRGSLFQPPKDQGAPTQSSGGAARGRLFQPIKGRGAPLRAAGGASRVGRYDLNIASPNPAAGPAALIALLPQTYSGTTVLSHPTLMVYLPASAAKTAIFSLKDEAGKMVYQQNLIVSSAGGLMAITLPASTPALDVNKHYQWYVALQVDGDLNPSTPYVDGWIQRIEPTKAVAAALQQADVLKQAEALGADGVWYDCVAKLAAVRASAPTNKALDQQWKELLESVGLQEIAQVPLVAAAVK